MTLSAKTLAVLQGGTQGPMRPCTGSKFVNDTVICAEDWTLCDIEPRDEETDAANARKIALVNALADVAVKAAEVRKNLTIEQYESGVQDVRLAALDASLQALEEAANNAK